jgi:hypothetical protein
MEIVMAKQRFVVVVGLTINSYWPDRPKMVVDVLEAIDADDAAMQACLEVALVKRILPSDCMVHSVFHFGAQLKFDAGSYAVKLENMPIPRDAIGISDGSGDEINDAIDLWDELEDLRPIDNRILKLLRRRILEHSECYQFLLRVLAAAIDGAAESYEVIRHGDEDEDGKGSGLGVDDDLQDQEDAEVEIITRIYKAVVSILKSMDPHMVKVFLAGMNLEAD